MKHIFLFYISLTAIISCGEKNQSPGKMVLTLDSAQTAALPVTIALDSLYLAATKNNYPFLQDENQDTIPAQMIDTDGNGEKDALFFIADFSNEKQKTYTIGQAENELAFEKKANTRFGVRKNEDSKVQPAVADTFYPNQLPAVIGYQRYQTDGPTWENDKVGFRIYLDGRNSIDVFGKTKPAITPANVGIGADGNTEYNYAAMLDWGTDILAVANSVGIGGVALKQGDSLLRLGITDKDTLNNVDTTIATVLHNGPLNTAIHFDYRGWRPANETYHATMQVETWPGMYGYKNTITVNHLTANDTLLAGLVNSNTGKPLTVVQSPSSNWVIVYTHDKQSVDKNSWLGLALVIPAKAYAGYLEAPKSGTVSNSYFVKLAGESVSYYAFACWELTDKRFADEDFFRNYLIQTADQLFTNIKVEVH